jgi:hypothetical protein
VARIDFQLDLSPRKQAWRDLRATVRYRCAPATYGRVLLNDQQEADQEYQRAWLSDLSLGGVGLTMARPIPSHSSIHVLLRNPVSHELVILQGQVVHCTSQVNGEWLIGCKLDRALTAEVLEQLLG